ncbi:MAG TPA: transporter substrate-binding domain-containing protein [Spirochaetales bacterium]|nr:transporter substrate-binding domain-containing protein [Spirochaetales bacterium]
MGKSTLAALALAVALSPAAARPLVYGLVPNAPPTTYVDAAGEPTGFFVELYSRIMDELGIDYEFRVGGFAELYPLMVSGEVDFFTTLVRTPEREESFHFSDDTASAGWSQLFVANETELRSVLDLQHRRIGVVTGDRNGASFGVYAESLAIPCELVEYQDFDALVEAVAGGEVFAGVQSNWFVAVQTRVKGTTIVFAPFRSYPVLSRKSPFTAEFEAINRRYAELVADSGSWYYELQAEWLGHERTETVVVPAWLAGGFAILALATLVSVLVIRALTRKLRLANRDLEAKVLERSAMLVEADRMASLGDLVAGLAHELNSPLQAALSGIDAMEGLLRAAAAGPAGSDGLAPPPRAPDAALADSRAARRAALGALERAGYGGRDELADFCLALGVVDPDPDFLARVAAASPAAREFALERARASIALDASREAVARIGAVIGALRIYAHRDSKGGAVRGSVAAQIDAVLSLLTPRTRDAIEVVRDYAEVPDFPCRPDRLGRVWMNLAMNAVDAMGSSGRLTVRIRPEAGWIAASFSDTGPGIPEAVARRMYEPFFTTKPPGKGTGLGLSVSREIVRDHGGDISYSGGPLGSTFTVRLPFDAEPGGSACHG